GAQRGDKVVAKIVKYPDKEYSAEGKITEIIGRAGEPGSDIKALIRQYNLTEAFPAKVIAESKSAMSKPYEISQRVDLRNKVVFTIDGADAKDLDDAVSIEKNQDGNYVLGVHIADVSFYVKEDGALDKEALKRGNSVYLIDQVIPMLPKALSNGICSLSKGEDRLTLSINMEITPNGQIVNHQIYESVIHSCERMVYTDVSDILEHKNAKLIKKYDHIYQEILLMNELAAILNQRRVQRGSLNFDLDEAYIRLDSKGKAESVGIAERRTANKIIEEFMLAANETIAERFFWLDTPFVYRVHAKPSLEKMEEFKVFIKNFGLILKGNAENIHPRALSELLTQVDGKPYEGVVNTVMLRAMKKALYSTECEGHFGLGLKYYCHFTSPIRRYPDLIIHRIIKETLAAPLNKGRIKALKKKTENAAETASTTEKRALELEREVEKMKKTEYMSYHIGEVFEGVISGVMSYGLYVELPNTIEGMIRVDSIDDDFYDYEPQKYRIIGRRTNKIFSLGDKIKIIVKSADVVERQIDFAIYK
ncbi:MAG: ribonuclease R, partial [Clostridiales bacterium]|nr:ribonuclease R [Clostridiales bacterium]